MNIAQLVGKEEKFDGEYGGKAYWFKAFPQKLSPRMQQQFTQATTMERPVGLAEALSDLVSDWSIYLKKKGDFPPILENLEIVPSEFLWDMVLRMKKSWNPEAEKIPESAITTAE